jgi:hypothetical protein
VASIVSGPFLAACVVLALAGAKKLRRPAVLQPALSALGLRPSATTARAVGAAEVTVALLGAAFGSFFALPVAAAYAILALVALRLLRRSPSTPCGCLGGSTAPVTTAHVVVNVVAAVVAALAATVPSPLTHLPDEIAGSIAFFVLVGCLAAIVSLLVDAQPALRVAMQRGRAR